jgi:Osmosensitive K+ channel His kinase sensor domain
MTETITARQVANYRFVVGLPTRARLHTSKVLEVVPHRKHVYRGPTFEEMDTDAVLRRRPNIALVDELAHANIPGSQRAKRWEDVQLLLEAGIVMPYFAQNHPSIPAGGSTTLRLSSCTTFRVPAVRGAKALGKLCQKESLTPIWPAKGIPTVVPGPKKSPSAPAGKSN